MRRGTTAVEGAIKRDDGTKRQNTMLLHWGSSERPQFPSVTPSSPETALIRAGGTRTAPNQSGEGWMSALCCWGYEPDQMAGAESSGGGLTGECVEGK